MASNEHTPLLAHRNIANHNEENWSEQSDSEYSYNDDHYDTTVRPKLEISLQNPIISSAVGDLKLVSQLYESLDYDICENSLFLEEQRQLPHGAAEHTCTRYTCLHWIKDKLGNVGVMRWIVMFFIGVFTALTACCITIAVDQLSSLKFDLLKKYVDKSSNSDDLSVAFCLWLLLCAVPVFIGSFLVTCFAPVASGSGIPVIKCYLNGVKVPEVVRLKTLVIKAFGVVTSVVGGLAVGKEGPMIHCGAVIAAGISQGKSTTFKKDLKIFEKFREDHEKRDFVSAGAAAGVAAAFGAPVGGVLFSLEEGASFWNQGLTWRIFFCSMVSFFTLNMVMSCYESNCGQLSYPGLLNFGSFEGVTYTVMELPLYILLGVLGGLLGALYNYLNQTLTRFRLRYVTHPAAKILEAVIVSLVGVCVAFMTLCYTSYCQTIDSESPLKPHIQLNCSDGEYNTFGAIWFQTPESSVRSLFHDEEESWRMLIIFFMCYYVLGCWTYGLSISSGLFVPTLLIGAAGGRLFGIGLQNIARGCNLHHDIIAAMCPAKFAVVGAAAMLGGVVRMTISLTVILMEALGSITFGLPIMVAVMTAKWVGDCFNEGLYDIHIQLARVPLLPWEPPLYSYHIDVSRVMSSPVICLNPIEKVGKIIEILKTESHNGFPVVDFTEDSYDGVNTFGVFRGLILRWQLIVLLQHKVFSETSRRYMTVQRLHLSDFRDAYPRYPAIQQIHVSPYEENYTLDLRPYMNPAAYTISSNASLPRIFRLFRALGLRHLPVVDERNSVVGIVTRKDIARFRAETHYGRVNIEELGISCS